MQDQDLSSSIQGRVEHAVGNQTPLHIIGGNSKTFYGAPVSASELLNVSGHCGIVSYEPTEQVIRVRAGTPLVELNNALKQQGQMLAFEPPLFSDSATIGGTIACGFSGPRRPFAGSARDSVLGCSIINGLGERMQFGGQVMKNVAGFDVSRLMTGAMGQLGVLLDISLRVLPIPEAETTLCQQCGSNQQALEKMIAWQGQPWPLSALAYDGQLIWMRLSGAEAAIHAAAKQLGGEYDPEGGLFWHKLRDHKLDFFQKPENLWRISTAPTATVPDIEGDWMLDWGGAQRWLKSPCPSALIHGHVGSKHGHAVCFRGNDKNDWLRLEPGLYALHKKIRLAFDPYRLFNPDRFSLGL